MSDSQSTRPGAHAVAIVTGGGSGIGRAVCLKLAQAGYDLVIMGRSAETLEETASMLPAGVRSIVSRGDVADAGDVRRCIDSAMAEFGRIDAVVNNAGYAPLKPIDQSDPKLLHRTFAVNAYGPACMIHAAWPHLAARKSDGGGCIVNISTMGTKDPFPGFFAYAAAKAAVNLMARSCANEGRGLGIRAFAVAPGAVETEMLRSNFPESKVPASAALPPERVADLVVECIRGEHNGRNGQTLFISAQRGVE